MRAMRMAAMVCVGAFLSMCTQTAADGDIINFKRGLKKKYVIIEESEESVSFLTSMGPVSMPRSRIESIERESEEINEALRKKWKRIDRKTPEKKDEAAEEPAVEKPRVRRTYNVNVTRRRKGLGMRMSELEAHSRWPLLRSRISVW
ncbi:MAG: hypothetical protein JSV16_13585 [Candidatus Hydrogenedentota bacterium]|nr:MAG: hypothetical protein JSV16_13585 [Candidatus Hydrogenedentota bacterium]